MIDLHSIKLIIWDLDETLWAGTLSEGSVYLSQDTIDLVKDLTDCGIINSICSKNDFLQAKQCLQKYGIWDLFVFPSINWEAKGAQIKEKVYKMALRPVNVLFIDDNPSNLGEAKHYMPEIKTAGPDAITDIKSVLTTLEKKDLEHKRLAQYKVLERKDHDSRFFNSNEAFLYSSDIHAEIHQDCIDKKERLHELLLRSNQLNFTKKRISLDAFESILKDQEYDCGYVTVTDRYGDYGIVGFYAIKYGRLEHFFFSCRTMGQKIEQWTYAQLGFPELEVIGEVRTILNKRDCPGWINCSELSKEGNKTNKDKENNSNIHCRVLLKGPCDLSHSQVYIKKIGIFDTEFTYVSNTEGQIIDSHNHSAHIEGLHTYSEQEKSTIINDCVFVDPPMLDGLFFSREYDVIFLSTLIESSRLIYQKRGTDIRVVFGNVDLTKPSNWEGFVNGVFYTGGNRFSYEWLKQFSTQYDCIGITTPEMYVSFLNKCMEWLPQKTVLCLILGATKVFPDAEQEKRLHKRLNDAILTFANNHDRIKCIELDSIISDTSDFTDGLNHFSTRVYFELANEMIKVIKSATGETIHSYSPIMIKIDKLILSTRRFLKTIVSPKSNSYHFLKDIYNRIYKHRK